GSNDLPDQRQVYERRNRGEKELEQPGLRYREKTQRAVPRPERNPAVLPQTLQRAIRPAEALLDEGPYRIGRFGPASGRAVVEHRVTSGQHRHRQVLVLGERIEREAAQTLERLPFPGTDGTGNHRDATKRGKRPALEVLTGDIFKRLPARDHVDAVADLGIAGHGTDRRVAEPAHEL